MSAKPADPTAAGIAVLLSLGHKPAVGPKPTPAEPPPTPPPVSKPIG